VDEGIHLVSAFELAGFWHVIGTLWEVSDEHCVGVARVLYETLGNEGMTDAAVCRGLHRAVRDLRYGGIKDREERDAKLVCVGTKAGESFEEEDDTSAEREPPGTQARGMKNSYWVPYVHFVSFQTI